MPWIFYLFIKKRVRLFYVIHEMFVAHAHKSCRVTDFERVLERERVNNSLKLDFVTRYSRISLGNYHLPSF